MKSNNKSIEHSATPKRPAQSFVLPVGLQIKAFGPKNGKIQQKKISDYNQNKAMQLPDCVTNS
jgi:hypothetical protein